MDGFGLEVVGADEAVLKLTILDATLDNAGEEGGHRSAEVIARSARLKMPVGPIEGGHVRDTARAEGMAAVLGGTFYPYTGWLEFGGRVGRGNKVGAGIYREKKLPHGRYLYPSYVQHMRDVDYFLARETTEVIENAGFEDS